MKTIARLDPRQEYSVDIMPISDNPEYAAVQNQLKELEAALAEKTSERAKIVARSRGVRTKRSSLERASDLLKGGRIDATPPANALVAIDEEILILQSAITTKTRELDAISSELSFIESMKLRPEFLKEMRAVYDHLQEAVAAYGRAADLPVRMYRAGFRASAVTMPEIAPPSLTALRTFELPAMQQRLAALEAMR